jgi:hypothetical protein
MCDNHAQLDSTGAKLFVLGGKAFFTLVSTKTGKRFTFKVSRKLVEDDRVLYFVGLLTGPTNTSDYTFFGTIFDGVEFRMSGKSRIRGDAPSALAFKFLWKLIQEGHEFPKAFEFWTIGQCGQCGLPLTVPASIKIGFGPHCAEDKGLGHLFSWDVLLADGTSYEVTGGHEKAARASLRDILGRKRLPKGVQLTLRD